jgi:Ca2+-dependent lipid-binding protein
VRVVRGANLPAADLNGKSDVYCRFGLGLLNENLTDR